MRNRILAAALAFAAAGTAGASTVNLTWVQTYATNGAAAGTAGGSSGTLVLNVPSVSSVTPTLSFSDATATVSSFSFTENGNTITTLPTESPWSATSGVLTGFTDGVSATVSATLPSMTFTAAGAGAGLLSLNSALGSSYALFSSYLGGANEIAGNGSFTLTGTLLPKPGFTASGSGVGYLGYWKVQAVPLPAAALLFGSGLFGLGALRRRRDVNRRLGTL